MSDEPQPDPVTAALEAVRDRHGAEGLRAVALFAFALGSEAGLTGVFDNPEDWMPMDFVMQEAWEMGGTPLPMESADA